MATGSLLACNNRIPPRGVKNSSAKVQVFCGTIVLQCSKSIFYRQLSLEFPYRTYKMHNQFHRKGP